VIAQQYSSYLKSSASTCSKELKHVINRSKSRGKLKHSDDDIYNNDMFLLGAGRYQMLSDFVGGVP
jgi:hypothetical protein